MPDNATAPEDPKRKKAEAEEVERARGRAEAATKARQRTDEADRAVDEKAEAERAAVAAPDGRNYGPFADHPQKFVVVSEMVGKHRAGDTITYRDLMAWADHGRQEPSALRTRSNAERLVAGGHIRPLVITEG